MYRRVIFGAALAALVAAGPTRAEPIPWRYNWNPSAPAVLADSPGTGLVRFTNEPTGAATGSTDVVATNLRAFSTASVGAPDRFTARPYGLVLTLTDTASGQAGALTFTGALSGALTANSSNLTNTFTGPQTQELRLGGNVYSVTMGSFTPPGPPSSANAGAINAYAEVLVSPAELVPEPSSLALAAAGLAAAGVLGRRKRPPR